MKRVAKHIAVWIMAIILVTFVQTVEVRAAAVPLPTDAATNENVLTLLGYYNADAHHIMSTKGGYLFWFTRGGIIDGIDTAVHETYHGYTSSEARKHGKGWNAEVLFAGGNEFYYICIDDFSGRIVPTEEMAKDIPSNLQTFRYNTYAGPGATASSNDKSMMYLLNEFSAYYWGLNTMHSLVPYLKEYDKTGEGWNRYASSLANNMTAYSEFKYWMLRYMIYMRNNHPDQYQEWLNCPGVREAYTSFETKFRKLIDDSIGEIPSINNDISSINCKLKCDESGVWCNRGNRGTGLPLDDYYKMMEELSKPEYIEMDSILKGGAGSDVVLSGIQPSNDGNYYLYNDNKIDKTYSGLYCDGTYGWWLILNGRVAREYNDLYNDATYGWWKITGGAVDFGYTGLYCSPNYGWWLIGGGSVAFYYNDLWQDANYGWWKINNGTVDFGYTGLYCSPSCGWWLIGGGTVCFDYYGTWADPAYGPWNIYGGAVTF